jgi:hypothetical protein
MSAVYYRDISKMVDPFNAAALTTGCTQSRKYDKEFAPSKPDASLTYRDEEKVTITTKRVPDRVELSLTIEEALTLASILGGVGGRDTSARSYSSSVIDKLWRVGISVDAELSQGMKNRTAIFYADFTKPTIQKLAEEFRAKIAFTATPA